MGGDEIGERLAGAEGIRAEDIHEEGDGRPDPQDDVALERPEHARDGRFAVFAVGHQLRQDGVVLHGHLKSGVDAAVVPDARPGGFLHEHDGSGRREESLLRVFRVDAALDGMTPPADLLLGEVQGEAGGDLDLAPDDVDAGHHLRDRVLDLEAGVDLQEIEAAVRVQQEFHRPRIHVAGRPGRGHGRLAHPLPQLRRQGGRRRLLDDFLRRRWSTAPEFTLPGRRPDPELDAFGRARYFSRQMALPKAAAASLAADTQVACSVPRARPHEVPPPPAAADVDGCTTVRLLARTSGSISSCR